MYSTRILPKCSSTDEEMNILRNFWALRTFAQATLFHKSVGAQPAGKIIYFFMM